MSTPSTNLLEEQAFLKPQEVATLLRVSTQTVRRWITGGELPAYKVGRAWRIKEIDLAMWLNGHRTATMADD
jgi:excisionase family DNA binding protein